MTLPMAFCLVAIGQTAMPAGGEHHGPGNPAVDVVVVVVERVYPSLHAARLGALCAMDQRHGAVLGRAYDHSTADSHRPGVPLAGAGTLRRVWRLGSRGGRTA